MLKKENLRKNFLRVKQIADQNFGRAEKSEVLSEDLQTVERRVDLVRQVCQTTSKKVALCLQGSGPDLERRHKKIPENVVALSMIESASLLGSDSIMGRMFEICGECHSHLARDVLQFELNVEKQVLTPLQEILDNDIPVINKCKKQLTKLTLDMDSARSRWNQAVKQTQVHGANMASTSAKADQIKEEYEEAANRMHQARDALATEMFNFIAKEADHSQKLLDIVRIQRDYHKQALESLERVLPKMSEALECNPLKPVYGIPLDEHLRVTGRDIALVLEACVVTLIEGGLEEEGLFRIAGMASKVKKLKNAFDANVVDMEEYGIDLHSVAGALKQYLRELPDPLLTTQLYEEFLQDAQAPSADRLQCLWSTIHKLPKTNYDNFRYLIKFLSKLADRSSENKMTPSNISIVIGPNLLWSEEDNGPNMITSGTISSIIEQIIIHADWFFPEEIDFHHTTHGTAPPRSLGVRETSSNAPVTATVMPMVHSQGRHSSSLSKACGMAYNTVVHPISSQDVKNRPSSSSDDCMSIKRSSNISLDSSIPTFPPGLSEEEAQKEGLSTEGESTHLAPIRQLGGGVKLNSNQYSLSSSSTNSVPKHNANDVTKSYGKNNISPRSRSVPPPPTVAKGVHSEMYSTMFALHSLGDGNVSNYMTKVRNLWDGHLQQHPQSTSGGQINRQEGGSGVTGHQRRCVSQEIEFGTLASLTKSNGSDAQDTGGFEPPSEQDVSSAPNGQQSSSESPRSNRVNQQPPSPSGSPPYTTGQQAPLADSEDTMPKVQKRIPRKPAPPPPPDRPQHLPDRPYSIAVTASMSKSNQLSSMTWPRQQASPGQDSLGESGGDGTKPKLQPDKPDRSSGNIQRAGTMVDRHSHPDRPTVPPPERPKVPPPAVPNHQRSASTGSPSNFIPQMTPVVSTQRKEENDQGSLSSNSYESVDTQGMGASLLIPSIQLQPSSEKHIQPNRLQQGSVKPVRPQPPAPPSQEPPSPPVNTATEETHL